jgi:5'/3'-nucleotidase SurE
VSSFGSVTRVKAYPAVEAWTVDGTPADCIGIAMDKLIDEEDISLVVSGIN